MKEKLLFLFLSITFIGFTQKKASKKVEVNTNSIEIITTGLDNIIVENSKNNFIEIFLFDEYANKHQIATTENKETLIVDFKAAEITEKETVFRKFITKRLERAYAIVKIPKNKSVTFFGENINIESKNYNGNLIIYIEKGILKLHKIKQNVLVKLYAGTIYANLKNTNINVASNLGKITVNDKIIKKSFKKENNIFQNKFTVKSIKANILLTTKNTQ